MSCGYQIKFRLIMNKKLFNLRQREASRLLTNVK